MYDELVNRLRYCQNNAAIITDDELMSVANDSANAIEELSMKLHGDEAAILGMKREIERMVVNGTHRWIPVTEENDGKV